MNPLKQQALQHKMKTKLRILKQAWSWTSAILLSGGMAYAQQVVYVGTSNHFAQVKAYDLTSKQEIESHNYYPAGSAGDSGAVGGIAYHAESGTLLIGSAKSLYQIDPSLMSQSNGGLVQQNNGIGPGVIAYPTIEQTSGDLYAPQSTFINKIINDEILSGGSLTAIQIDGGIGGEIQLNDHALFMSAFFDPLYSVVLVGHNQSNNTPVPHALSFFDFDDPVPAPVAVLHDFQAEGGTAPGGLAFDALNGVLYHTYYDTNDIYYTEMSLFASSNPTAPVPFTTVDLSGLGVSFADPIDVQFKDGRLYFLARDAANDHAKIYSILVNNAFVASDLREHLDLGSDASQLYRGFEVVGDAPITCRNKLIVDSTVTGPLIAGQTFDVTLELEIDGTDSALYALQAEIPFDPNLLEIVSSEYTAHGDADAFFNNANRLEVPIAELPYAADPSRNYWRGVVSFHDQDPGTQLLGQSTPVGETRRFAKITFKVKDTVTSSVSTTIGEDDGNTLFSAKPDDTNANNSGGLCIPDTCVVPFTISIDAGTASLQGILQKPIHLCNAGFDIGTADLSPDGFQVVLENIDNPAAPVRMVTVGSDGAFLFSNLPAAQYRVQGSKPGDYYIGPCITIPLADNQGIDLGSLNLLAGDVDLDGAIEASDAVALTANGVFGEANLASDLNQDGIVNVFDLAVLSSNYGYATCD